MSYQKVGMWILGILLGTFFNQVAAKAQNILSVVLIAVLLGLMCLLVALFSDYKFGVLFFVVLGFVFSADFHVATWELTTKHLGSLGWFSRISILLALLFSEVTLKIKQEAFGRSIAIYSYMGRMPAHAAIEEFFSNPTPVKYKWYEIVRNGPTHRAFLTVFLLVCHIELWFKLQEYVEMVPSGAFAEARAFVLQYAFQIAEITATVLPFLLLFGAFFSAIQMVNNWEELAESAALDSWQERIEEEWRHMGDADEN